jgi:uracil-DNA glycosylase family 4
VKHPCNKCGLEKFAYKQVGGNCILHPPVVVVVGEGPGKSEDVLGTAFVGPAGKLLRHALQQAGVDPARVWFTNLVACRACDSLGETNRIPTEEECEACWPRLKHELRQVCKDGVTDVILAGKTAARYNGAIQSVCPSGTRVHEITHPAAVLRQGGANEDGAAFQNYIKRLEEEVVQCFGISTSTA